MKNIDRNHKMFTFKTKNALVLPDFESVIDNFTIKMQLISQIDIELTKKYIVLSFMAIFCQSLPQIIFHSI